MKKSVMSSNERNEYLLSYGFNNENITRMYKKSNVLTGFKKETIERKLNALMNFGISKKDIIEIVNAFPQILTLSEENVTLKFKYLLDFGFQMDDIITINKKQYNIKKASLCQKY